MTKYGMRYRTIRYWQSQAVQYVKYNGRPDVMQKQLMFACKLQTGDARVIAHRAIACAAVCPTSAVKYAIRTARIYNAE